MLSEFCIWLWSPLASFCPSTLAPSLRTHPMSLSAGEGRWVNCRRWHSRPAVPLVWSVTGVRENLTGSKKSLNSRCWDRDQLEGNLLGNGLEINTYEGREGKEAGGGQEEKMDLRQSQGDLLGWSTFPSLLKFQHFKSWVLGNSLGPGKPGMAGHPRTSRSGMTWQKYPDCDQESGPLCPGSNQSLVRGCPPKSQRGISLGWSVSLQSRAISGEGHSCELSLTNFSLSGRRCVSVLKGGSIRRHLILQ